MTEGGRGSVAKQDDLRAGRNTGRILVRKCNEMTKCWKMKIATSSETEASTSGLQCRALSLNNEGFLLTERKVLLISVV